MDIGLTGTELASASAFDDHSQQLGEIFAAWRVTPTSLMLLGWQVQRPALEGSASLHQIACAPGRFVGAAWPTVMGRHKAYHFLLAVQAPAAYTDADIPLVLTGKRPGDEPVLARLPAHLLDAAAFGAELARNAPARAATIVARFLFGIFPSATLATHTSIREMLISLLDNVATPDGCVEMQGGVNDHCAILKGWGKPLGAGTDVVLDATSLQVYPAQEASYVRHDIKEPFAGQILILPAAVMAVGKIRSVYLLGQDGVRRRAVLSERQPLSGEETAADLRSVIPILDCNDAARGKLAAALRPAYEGRLTIYDAGHPFRIGIDAAITAPGAGLYLVGWIYDPMGVIENVHVAYPRSPSFRLDDCWTRISRPDVSDAFRNDSNLPAGDPTHHLHGFVVTAPHQQPEGAKAEPYLEISFSDGWCGFLPLVTAQANDDASRSRLLASVDLYKPSGMAVIERQLAPFFSRLTRSCLSITSPAPVVAPRVKSLLVVPLPTAEMPRALLAQTLREPLSQHEGILFVCGDNWPSSTIVALSELARFYNAPASIVSVEGVASPTIALRLAADIPTIEQVVLLSAGTVGCTPGWRSALEAVAHEHGRTACISPSVLYEDGSLQYAGCEGVEALDERPYLRLRRSLAGFPASFAMPGPAVHTHGLSVACSLFPRWVLDTLVTLEVAAITAWEPELALLQHLQRIAPDCLWAPSVQVYAPEDSSPTDLQYSANRLVARWCIRAALVPEEHS